MSRTVRESTESRSGGNPGKRTPSPSSQSRCPGRLTVPYRRGSPRASFAKPPQSSQYHAGSLVIRSRNVTKLAQHKPAARAKECTDAQRVRSSRYSGVASTSTRARLFTSRKHSRLSRSRSSATMETISACSCKSVTRVAVGT